MLARADPKVRGRSGVRRCGPSRRRARNALAAFKIFVRHPKKDFCNNIGTKRTCRPQRNVRSRGQSGKHLLALSFSERRITWEHEYLLEAVQQRLDANPQAMRQRRETVEHPFGTMKARMGRHTSSPKRFQK
jgi:hypothetical protein